MESRFSWLCGTQRECLASPQSEPTTIPGLVGARRPWNLQLDISFMRADVTSHNVHRGQEEYEASASHRPMEDI